MASFVPLSRSEHATLTWRRPTGYAFAAGESMVPIAAVEAGQGAADLPLAFVRSDGRMQFVALLAAEPGRNSFVAGDGRWLGGYIPALLRAFPFQLRRIEGHDGFALCIASDGYLGTGTEPIYDASGTFAPRVNSLASFLRTFERSRLQTMAAAAALDKAGVLAPWSIKRHDGRAEPSISGAWRVDEEALSSLPEASYLELRRTGALGIAYAQLLSISRLEILGRLSRFASSMQARQRATMPSLDFLRQDDGNLVF